MLASSLVGEPCRPRDWPGAGDFPCTIVAVWPAGDSAELWCAIVDLTDNTTYVRRFTELLVNLG